MLQMKITQVETGIKKKNNQTLFQIKYKIKFTNRLNINKKKLNFKNFFSMIKYQELRIESINTGKKIKQ